MDPAALVYTRILTALWGHHPLGEQPLMTFARIMWIVAFCVLVFDAALVVDTCTRPERHQQRDSYP